MKSVSLTGLFLLSLSSGLLLADKATDERLANAARAFDEIMTAPDKGIPGSVLNKAECVVVVPGMKKGGFIVGGSFGRGTVTCRTKDKAGWGAPAMVELGRNKILSTRAARGVFGGVSLQGSTLQQDEGAIKPVHGKQLKCLRHSRWRGRHAACGDATESSLDQDSAKGTSMV